MTIDFIKTHALGNDFLLTERGAIPESGLSPLAQKICHRNFGVGADGLIYWKQSGDVFDLRIFNCDGSEPECSGNGLRCTAAYLIESGRWPAATIKLRTVSGIYTLTHVGAEYEADMGVPGLRPEAIPFLTTEPIERVVDYPLVVDGETVRITACSTGNPHCSLFLTNLSDADVENTIHRLGPKLERHAAFPNRTNVEFIRVISDRELHVDFWERGVGPTWASGTGSCGATVAAILNGRTGRSVTVFTRAGKLRVEWPENGRLKLTSTAAVVAEGRYLDS
jgi:diaminopimelate epimerase